MPLPGSNFGRFLWHSVCRVNVRASAWAALRGQIGVTLLQMAKNLKVKEVKWFLQSHTNSLLPLDVRWSLLRRGRKYFYGGWRNPVLRGADPTLRVGGFQP